LAEATLADGVDGENYKSQQICLIGVYTVYLIRAAGENICIETAYNLSKVSF